MYNAFDTACEQIHLRMETQGLGRPGSVRDSSDVTDDAEDLAHRLTDFKKGELG